MAAGSVAPVRAASAAVLMVWLSTAALAAQEPRLAAALPPTALAAISAQLDSAASARLPVEPLIQKALEGAAKGAPDAVLVRAVRDLRGRLETARDRLGRASAEADLVAGAAALYAGVEPDALARLRRAAPQLGLAMPLVVLADLIGRGVPSRAAADAVVALTRAGASDDAFRGFRLQVEQDIRAGAVPLDAARIRLRGLVPVGAPAAGGTAEVPGGKP